MHYLYCNAVVIRQGIVRIVDRQLFIVQLVYQSSVYVIRKDLYLKRLYKF